MRAIPRLEWRCTHRGASRRAHLEALAALRATLGPTGEAGTSDRSPLVLVHCGERGERMARDARLGCEVVHVRVDGQAAVDQAAALVRGAMRFAEEVGDLRGPRRGPLAGFGRSPLEVRAPLCPGSARCGVCIDSCPARALRPGADGHPTTGGGACTCCGDCIGRCPLGAIGYAHAPWRALNARLEALLANAAARPLALVLCERSEPPPPDDPRETAQPHVPWILPLELPRGALGAGVVLRALELGAAAVCAVVPRDDASCAAGARAAIALARAMGCGDRVALARSLDEGVELLRHPPPWPRPPFEPVPREPAQRPDAHAIASSMWLRDAFRSPRRIALRGAFGGVAAVESDACTLCGLCVAACPTGALTQRRATTVALGFDSGLCPRPCGRCESACPARALTVSPELRLPPERTTLVERPGTCAACGELWPEAATIPALGPRLAAGEAPALLAFLSTCSACRSRALATSLPRARAACERA